MRPRWLVAAGVLAAAAGALGQTAVQGPAASAAVTLADAVDAAWRRAAVAAEVSGQAARAQAGRATVASRWAGPPALELALLRDRQRATGTTRETELGLALPLWLPGQRAAHGGVVDADIAAARAAEALARWRVAGTVREAAAELALQRTELAMTEAQHRELDVLAQDVERRVAAGDLARADALAAHAERLAAATALSQARHRLRAAGLHWVALTGLPAEPLRAPPAEAAVAGPIDTVAAPVLPEAHPVLQATAAAVDTARRRLALVRASGRESPELLLSARHEAGAGEPATRGVGVALRIPFGTEGRQAPMLAEALAALEAAEAAALESRRQLEAELAAARLAAQAARAQRADEAVRARLLRERATLIDKSFKAGETALPEALRALTAATQAEAALARADAALAQSVSRLQQALGEQP